jgi:hypothetical protein
MEIPECILPPCETLEDPRLLDERIRQCLHDTFTILTPPEQIRELILRQIPPMRDAADCQN